MPSSCCVGRGFEDATTQLWVESLFVFSVVWGVGATGDTDGRQAFDTFFRYLDRACIQASPTISQTQLECLYNLRIELFQ